MTANIVPGRRNIPRQPHSYPRPLNSRCLLVRGGRHGC
jgi:hypothetical protein